LRPAWVWVAAISSTITSWDTSGRPRQFMEMWLNSRCSILFHLEVPGGEVAHGHCKASLGGEAGQLGLPGADPIAVGPARIGTDQQPGCGGVQRPTGLLPPAPQRRHRKRRGVVVGAHAHPASVGAQVIDPVGDRLAQLLVGFDTLIWPHPGPL
jgi:hypothetical protein